MLVAFSALEFVDFVELGRRQFGWPPELDYFEFIPSVIGDHI
jgi:hypothetical protein